MASDDEQHFEVCPSCSDHRLALCPTGARLLEAARSGIAPTEGTILESSPRAADWQRIFGGLRVRLLSPVPVLADSPVGRRRFYKADVAALNAGQRERLVSFLAERFSVPPVEVERGLDDAKEGLPILDEDLCVSFDHRLVC